MNKIKIATYRNTFHHNSFWCRYLLYFSV